MQKAAQELKKMNSAVEEEDKEEVDDKLNAKFKAMKDAKNKKNDKNKK